MSARSFIAGGVDLIQNARGNAMTTITVFGGTGFLGRRLVQRLAAEGATVRVAVRHPDPARSV
jgi:NADH dehydrogenase